MPQNFDFDKIPVIDGARLTRIETTGSAEDALEAIIDDMKIRAAVIYIKFPTGGYLATIITPIDANAVLPAEIIIPPTAYPPSHHGTPPGTPLGTAPLQIFFPQKDGKGEAGTWAIGTGATPEEAATKLLGKLRDPSSGIPDYVPASRYDLEKGHLRVYGTQQRFKILTFS